MRIRTPFLTVFAMLAMASVVHAQTPEPPTDLVVSDTPDDAGQSVEVDWSLSGTDIFNPLNTNAKETSPEVIVATYAIERKVLNGHGADVSDEDTHWRKVSEAGAGESHWTDRSVNLGWTYDYRVCAIDNQGDASSWCDAQNAVTPSMQLFNSSKAWLAIFMLIFGVF
ncbi:MAG: hypothetical protein CMJ26_02440, partial [Phycisphaerae bacterium]|nr:hypothetical protein [Phycisphaerae bacterium]